MATCQYPEARSRVEKCLAPARRSSVIDTWEGKFVELGDVVEAPIINAELLYQHYWAGPGTTRRLDHTLL